MKKLRRLLALTLALVLVLSSTALAASLRLNDRNEDVRAMQVKLIELGYLTGNADGKFGPATLTAVTNFQVQNGLEADGVAGSQTLRKLNEAYNAKKNEASSAAPVNPGTKDGLFGGDYTRIVRDDRGNRVIILQQALKDLGYVVGAVDGAFGDTTYEAVKLFQKGHRLSVDGKAGRNTLQAIESYFNKDGSLKDPNDLPGKSDTIYESTGNIPTRTLRAGYTGTDVVSVQDRLQTLGYYTGKLDGLYDADVMNAVRIFQARNGLTADGLAGSSTYAILYSGKAIGAGDATPAPTARPTAAPTSAVPNRTLREGDAGSDVTAVQSRLKALGYYKGKLDGKYGAGTIAAVMAFQMKHNLTADGNAGQKTYAILFSNNALSASTATATPVPTPTATPFTGVPSRTLQDGDTGADVASVQTRLKALGYYSGTVDGKFGSGTIAAVMAFQRKHGLAMDGRAGSGTYAVLYSNNALSASTATATPVPTAKPVGTAPSRTLREGDTGADVTSVQSRLKALGYYTGTIDGKYGAGTIAAVMAFQRKHGLGVDGNAGSATYAILFTDAAVSAGGAAPTPTPHADADTYADAYSHTLHRRALPHPAGRRHGR